MATIVLFAHYIDSRGHLSFIWPFILKKQTKNETKQEWW
jgi:hypothetical protein